MADVTREEAVKLIEAHEHVVRRWAGAHHDKIEEAMHEQIASREPIIAALTRPAPQPSDDDEALVDRLIYADRDEQTCDTMQKRAAWAERAEAEAALLARLAASRVPDELMAALATLFHGYCRLEDTGLKFTMQVGPEPYLQHGIDPHAHVKAWRVIHDTLYPAAPAPEVKK